MLTSRMVMSNELKRLRAWNSWNEQSAVGRASIDFTVVYFLEHSPEIGETYRVTKAETRRLSIYIAVVWYHESGYTWVLFYEYIILRD